ncbi:MAG: DDE-type integrase/transposase/recombinase [Nitrososphaerales archaeon]
MVKVKGLEGWVWVAYEPYQHRFLALSFSLMRSILTAELFLKKLIRHYGKHTVYTDGALWYQKACKSLGLDHRLLYEDYKSIIERAIQYFKDRIESFNEYYPCRKRECSLKHI